MVIPEVVDIRDFAGNKHRRVDDMPYGGGSGMVMGIEPVVNALESVQTETKMERRTLLMTPRGEPFHQRTAERLATYHHLILICGRYEGIDQRITEFVDEEISVGDYILAGGETAALVVCDAVIRLLPGVMGNPNSLNEESFEGDLLEYPHYTRPREFRGLTVPEILLNGNHKEIYRWRRDQQTQLTEKRNKGSKKKDPQGEQND